MTPMATEFFTRRRSAAEIRELLIELPENHLQLATKEAREGKFDLRKRERRIATQAAAAQEAARFEARRVGVDPEARAALPAPRTARPRPRHGMRAARRFWARVDGADLSHELRGYDQFLEAQRLKAAATVWHRWQHAPIDPITRDEYEAMTTKSIHTRRARNARQAAARAMRRGELIAPAGISYERAEAIARQMHTHRDGQS